MQQSTDRILTTHVGSLARPHGLLETMREKEHGRPYNPDSFARQVREAVFDVVRRQSDVGLDVVTDGEQGKASFFTYVTERLGGFTMADAEPVRPLSWQREVDAFPEYYQEYFGKYSSTVTTLLTAVCVGPVTYQGKAAVETDIENLQAALAQDGVDATEAFLPSASPRGFGCNRYYASDEEYLVAVADALREEYRAIIDAGLVLQIDDPWLIEILSSEGRAAGEAHVEILNHALSGLPPERIRMHTCYGLNHGPRVHDIPFRDVVDVMLRVNAAAYSFEVANPRHQHEWRIWEDVRLPEGKVLIPGFLGHATSYVEHPELIADGIVTYANLVGRENVIAGADCGFSSRATFQPEVHPTVVWAKFAALAEGAALATRRLWP